ncbi:hypothetical protein Hte_007046 [Hypoxylon texense]
MCRNVHLEICCEDQELHRYFISFPYTLRTANILALCQDQLYENQLQKEANPELDDPDLKGIYTVLEPTEGCFLYNPNYVRDERIYFTTCDDCIRTRAAAAHDFTEQDLQINLEYNHILLQVMMDSIRQKEYFQLVQDFYFEFGITRRYILYGLRWYELALPDPDSLTLQPDPPYVFDFPATWMLSQIMTDAMLDQVGNEFRESLRPVERRVESWLEDVHSVEQQVMPEQEVIQELEDALEQEYILAQDSPRQEESLQENLEYLSELDLFPV